MNITVTGSLGNIGKPLTEELVQKGHTVTVISRSLARQQDIQALGARAAIGSLENADFLTSTFIGADAVFAMVPPNYRAPDMRAYYRGIGHAYAGAIGRSNVKRVVHLSSFGAHLDRGAGPILGSHDVEGILNGLDATLTHLRPTYFYYNLYGYIEMIKGQGLIAANYGGDDKIPMVAPSDIAAAAAAELEAPHGERVRYVASDEHTANEVAQTLGAAIGKPDLQWVTITDEQMRSGLKATGMSAYVAGLLVDMYASLHSGALTEDYEKYKPSPMGKVKLKDFAEEFSAAFNKA